MLAVAAAQVPALIPDAPHTCDDCEGWNKAREPFKIFGNSYFVGTDGLSSILIVGNAGHILLDGGLEQTAPLIDANIRKRTNAKVHAVAADVATAEGQAALFAACPEPDILVANNAGPPFRDFRELDRAKMIDGVIGNMIVPVELLQRAIDPMIRKKFGRIVNITSGSVKMPLVGLDLSSGARAGLTAFLAGVARSVDDAARIVSGDVPL